MGHKLTLDILSYPIGSFIFSHLFLLAITPVLHLLWHNGPCSKWCYRYIKVKKSCFRKLVDSSSFLYCHRLSISNIDAQFGVIHVFRLCHSVQAHLRTIHFPLVSFLSKEMSHPLGVHLELFGGTLHPLHKAKKFLTKCFMKV